jgi:hypothetical protein
VGATAFLTGFHVKQIGATAFLLGSTVKLQGLAHHIKLVENELMARKGHQFDVYKEFYDKVMGLFQLPAFDPHAIENFSAMSGLPSHTDIGPFDDPHSFSNT